MPPSKPLSRLLNPPFRKWVFTLLVATLTIFRSTHVYARSQSLTSGFYRSTRYNLNRHLNQLRPQTLKSKDKVEFLGAVLKRHIADLRQTKNKQVELVFLVDNSGSVGAHNFFNEIKFVRKLLADFTVDEKTTRVAIVTFSSRSKIIKHVDFLTSPSPDNHKCSLLEEYIPKIRYSGGGTFTLGAFKMAEVSIIYFLKDYYLLLCVGQNYCFIYKVYDFVDISLDGCRNSSAISVVDCRKRREIPVPFYNGNITNRKKIVNLNISVCRPV